LANKLSAALRDIKKGGGRRVLYIYMNVYMYYAMKMLGQPVID